MKRDLAYPIQYADDIDLGKGWRLWAGYGIALLVVLAFLVLISLPGY